MGPLSGIKVIELKGIGPGPYAGMLLADMGADVIVVERSTSPGSALPSKLDINSRGKRSIALNLQTPQGLEALLRLVERSDVLFEGFRPGVAERLGFGPEICLQRNPKLVYGRLTGWGQAGPLAHTAGHDLNYIALSGSLAAIGTKEKPVIPLNLVGDYAGGSHFLVMGILAAYIEAQRTGKGQVIDAAITDGSASLLSLFYSLHHSNHWEMQRASNFIDGGAHFYNVYQTSDGQFVSVAAIEPKFYTILLDKLALDPNEYPQHNKSEWPELTEKFASVFKRKTRDEWCEIFVDSDACFAPVLDMQEAMQHPHNKYRNTYIESKGIRQAAPAPRFSRHDLNDIRPAPAEGDDTEAVLKEFGFSEQQIAELK